MIVPPIYTGGLNENPIRFFRTPLNDQRPDFAWVSWDDLANAFSKTKKLSEILIQSSRARFPEAFHTVATSAGVTTISAHFAGQAIVAAVSQIHGTDFELEYAKLAMAALDALLPDVPRAYLIAAFYRWSHVS